MFTELRSLTARIRICCRALIGRQRLRCRPRSVKQTVTLTNNAPTSLMGGTSWYLYGSNNNLLYEKEVKANGITEQRHCLQAAGMTFAMALIRVGARLI